MLKALNDKFCADYGYYESQPYGDQTNHDTGAAEPKSNSSSYERCDSRSDRPRNQPHDRKRHNPQIKPEAVQQLARHMHQ